MRRMLQAAVFGSLLGSAIAVGASYGVAVACWYFLDQATGNTLLQYLKDWNFAHGLGLVLATASTACGVGGAIAGILFSGFQLMAETIRLSSQALQREISDLRREQQKL